MKIIKVDNFDRETSSDVVVAENTSKFFADLIVRLLNDWAGKNSSDYFKAVDNEHKLRIFEP